MLQELLYVAVGVLASVSLLQIVIISMGEAKEVLQNFWPIRNLPYEVLLANTSHIEDHSRCEEMTLRRCVNRSLWRSWKLGSIFVQASMGGGHCGVIIPTLLLEPEHPDYKLCHRCTQ